MEKKRGFSNRIGILPLMSCSCGNRDISNYSLIKKYIKKGNELGNSLKPEFEEENEKLKESIKDLSMIDKDREIRILENQHKKKMAEGIRKIFDELDIEDPCCRIQISDIARQGVNIKDIEDIDNESTEKEKSKNQKIKDKYFFSPEEYYRIK